MTSILWIKENHFYLSKQARISGKLVKYKKRLLQISFFHRPTFSLSRLATKPATCIENNKQIRLDIAVKAIIVAWPSIFSFLHEGFLQAPHEERPFSASRPTRIRHHVLPLLPPMQERKEIESVPLRFLRVPATSPSDVNIPNIFQHRKRLKSKWACVYTLRHCLPFSETEDDVCIGPQISLSRILLKIPISTLLVDAAFELAFAISSGLVSIVS